jgi:hypothetical protein
MGCVICIAKLQAIRKTGKLIPQAPSYFIYGVEEHGFKFKGHKNISSALGITSGHAREWVKFSM